MGLWHTDRHGETEDRMTDQRTAAVDDIDALTTAHHQDTKWTLSSDVPWCAECGADWPCLPYRLAERARDAEVERSEVAEAWAICRDERDRYGRALRDAEAKVAALTSALERTEHNFRSAVNGRPVRDMAENLAENRAVVGGDHEQPKPEPCEPYRGNGRCTMDHDHE
jgi:hypothetical protein